MDRHEREKSLAEVMEAEAREQVDEITKARVYQGKNADYANRRDAAIRFLSTTVRLLGTLENRRTNDMVGERLTALLEGKTAPQLTDGT